NGIIQSPAGYRSHSNSGTEYIRTFGQHQTRHKAAIAPSPDTYPAFINKLIFVNQVLSRIDLVFHFILTQLFIHLLLKIASASSGSPVIYAYDNITLLNQIAMPHRTLTGPEIFLYGLAPRSAIYIKKHRILF